jgi:hypothetical protein
MKTYQLPAFDTNWKEWYIWVVDYFKKSRFEFISYRKAIQELGGKT